MDTARLTLHQLTVALGVLLIAGSAFMPSSRPRTRSR